MNDEADEILDDLIEKGCFTVGENGQLYIVQDLLKFWCEPLWQSFMDDLDADLASLWSEGMIEIEFNDSAEVTYSMTQKGREYVETMKLLGQA